MKYCSNCGNPMNDHAAFCPDCGAQQQSFTRSAGGQEYGGQEYGGHAYGGQPYGGQAYDGQNAYGGQPYNGQPGGYPPVRGFGSVQERSIPLCVILSIVTCGLYGLYWVVCLNDDLNYLSDEPSPTSGVMVIVLGIVTCGIYILYWYYKMGNAVDRIRGGSGSTGILYLILGIFQLGIVNYILMQDTVNSVVRNA